MFVYLLLDNGGLTIPRIIQFASGSTMLGKLPVPGRPANLDYSRTRASALAKGANGVVWTFFFSHLSFLFFLPLSWRQPDMD